VAKAQPDRWPWEAYPSGACAGLFAAVSFYWAVGGTTGLRGVGGFAERMAHSGGAGAAAVIWATVAIKVAGAVLSLALVRPWGAALPRRWRAGVAGAGSVVLIIYGGFLVTGEALVELGVVTPSTPVDWTALRWHLALWDPWFLVWGLLLGTATWRFRRRPDEIDRTVRPSGGGHRWMASRAPGR